MSQNVIDNDNYIPLSIKILILGDTNVGKTVTSLTYTENLFDESHMATVGIDLKKKTLILNEFKISLEIWDTAGQERFRSLTKSFFNSVDGIVFMYDITNRESYNSLGNWIKDARNNVENIKGVILGNKKDLEKDRKVNVDLKTIEEKYKMPVLEGSAKTGDNIKKCFDILVDELLKNKTQEEVISCYGKDNENGNKLKPKLTKSKKKC